MKKTILLSILATLSLSAADIHMEKDKTISIKDPGELLTIYTNSEKTSFKMAPSIKCDYGKNGTHCALDNPEQQLPVAAGTVWLVQDSEGKTTKIFF